MCLTRGSCTPDGCHYVGVIPLAAHGQYTHTHTTDSLCNQKEKVEVSRVLQKKKEHKKYWQLFTEHTCCSLTSLLGTKHCGNVLLWRASLRLLMVFLLVKMADGQFRSLLICSAGGQRFPCCGFIQLNFTSTTSESTSRVHSSSLDAFSSPISPLYRTLLPPLPSATSACLYFVACLLKSNIASDELLLQ